MVGLRPVHFSFVAVFLRGTLGFLSAAAGKSRGILRAAATQDHAYGGQPCLVSIVETTPIRINHGILRASPKFTVAIDTGVPGVTC